MDKPMVVLSEPDIEKLTDQQVIEIANQLGIIGREKETPAELRIDLRSMIWRAGTFVLEPANQWLEPTVSAWPVGLISDYGEKVKFELNGVKQGGDYKKLRRITFENGRRNGLAIYDMTSTFVNERVTFGGYVASLFSLELNPEGSTYSYLDPQKFPDLLRVIFEYKDDLKHGPMVISKLVAKRDPLTGQVIFDEDEIFHVFYWINDQLVSQLTYYRYLQEVERNLNRNLPVKDLKSLVDDYLALQNQPLPINTISATTGLPNELLELISNYNNPLQDRFETVPPAGPDQSQE